MRRLFEALAIFDWVTPTVELVHDIKDTPKMLRGESNEYSIFVSSQNYPDALATLKRIGIKPLRRPVGLGIVRGYSIVVPYDELGKIQSALNQDGVKWSTR